MPAACRIPGRPLSFFSRCGRPPLLRKDHWQESPGGTFRSRSVLFLIPTSFSASSAAGKTDKSHRENAPVPEKYGNAPANSGRGGDFPPRPFLLPNRLFLLPSRRNRWLRYETLGRSHPSRRLRQKRRIEEQYVDLSPRIVIPESISDDVIAIPRFIEGNPVRTPGTVQTVTISDVHSRSKRLESNVRSGSRYRSASGEFDAAVRKVGPASSVTTVPDILFIRPETR